MYKYCTVVASLNYVHRLSVQNNIKTLNKKYIRRKWHWWRWSRQNHHGGSCTCSNDGKLKINISSRPVSNSVLRMCIYLNVIIYGLWFGITHWVIWWSSDISHTYYISYISYISLWIECCAIVSSTNRLIYLSSNSKNE